jgi:hypothetical protein
MEKKKAESEDLERVYQAVSPNDEPCDYPATVHCALCGRRGCCQLEKRAATDS